jgi:hypothetical protein
MACGAAVIVCDAPGLAGMVTSSEMDAMRQLNFGLRTLQRPITVDTILQEIDRYDAADAARVADRIRVTADVDLLAGQFITLYEELIAANEPLKPAEEMRAIGASLERLLPLLYERPEPSALARVRRRLISRMLALPSRFLYRLTRRFGV